MRIFLVWDAVSFADLLDPRKHFNGPWKNLSGKVFVAILLSVFVAGCGGAAGGKSKTERIISGLTHAASACPGCSGHEETFARFESRVIGKPAFCIIYYLESLRPDDLDVLGNTTSRLQELLGTRRLEIIGYLVSQDQKSKEETALKAVAVWHYYRQADLSVSTATIRTLTREIVYSPPECHGRPKLVIASKGHTYAPPDNSIYVVPGDRGMYLEDLIIVVASAHGN